MRVIPNILLLLDFDGTLSPIMDDPQDAILPEEIKEWLIGLTNRGNMQIGIISGRSLSDIRRKVPLKNIIYAASHGMEIYYKGRLLLREGQKYKRPLSKLSKKLSPLLADIVGVVVENKGLSVAVHFRTVRIELRNKVKKIVRETSEPWLTKYGLQLTSGKMLLEVRPALHWDKGKAALWIWKKLAPKSLPVYIGDDMTDEDAFTVLRPYGLTIRIGKKKGSNAEFYVTSIKTVIHSKLFSKSFFSLSNSKP